MTAFDTLAASRMLMERGLSKDAAEGVAELLGKTIEAELATKRDLMQLQHDLELKMQMMKRDIVLAMGGMLACAVTILLAALPLILR